MYALLVQHVRSEQLRIALRGKYVECKAVARQLEGSGWREVGILFAGRQWVPVEVFEPGALPAATPETAGTRFSAARTVRIARANPN